MNQATPENIIVRMPNWIGDAVMATPLLYDLNQHYPDAKITVMCLPAIGDMLQLDPIIEEIFTFKRPSGWLHRQGKRNILTPLRHGNYELGILTTNSFSSAWWFLRGHVKKRIGFATNLRSPLLTHAIPFPANKETQHLVLTYKHLLQPLGIPVSNTAPYLVTSDQEKDRARNSLKKFGVTSTSRIVGINPGAAYGTAKCWLPENFRAVTKKLLEHDDLYVLYFGDKQSNELINHICHDLPERAINLAGKTSLRELMALLSQCTCFLTNDSGPMHMASALNIPLVAIFGSTSDVKTGPYNQGVVIHKHVPCSPCYQRTCPIDFRCMTSITPDEVLAKLQRFLPS